MSATSPEDIEAVVSAGDELSLAFVPFLLLLLLLLLLFSFSSLYLICIHRVRHCRCVRPGTVSAILIQHLPNFSTPARSNASSSSLHLPLRTVGSSASVQRAWHWMPVRFGMRSAMRFQGIGWKPPSPSGMPENSRTEYFSTASSCSVQRPLCMFGLRRDR